MSKGDFSVIGPSSAFEHRVAASAARGYAGEYAEVVGTYSSGIASVNTVVRGRDAHPVIGTDLFVGIFHKDMPVNSSGTVVVGKVGVSTPIPQFTRIRGKAKTVANCDTDAELLGLYWDVVLFDDTSSVQTFDETGAADTSGLTIVFGDIAKGTLDVIVDARAMRADVS